MSASLEALYMRAWIEGLKERNDAPPVRAVEHPTGFLLLADTQRAPLIRLRPAEGPR